MKGILINPDDKSIQLVESSQKSGFSIRELMNLIGCDGVDCITYDEKHSVWVDHAGFVKEGLKTWFFPDPEEEGIMTIVAGKALLAGVGNDGCMEDVALLPTDVKVLFSEGRTTGEFFEAVGTKQRAGTKLQMGDPLIRKGPNGEQEQDDGTD